MCRRNKKKMVGLMVRVVLRTRVAFLLLCLTCVSVKNLMAEQAGQAEAFAFEGVKPPAGEQRGFLGRLLQRILPKYKKLELQEPVRPIALSELGNAAFAVLKVQEEPAYGWLAEDISQRLERVKSAGDLNGAEREFKELLNAALAVEATGSIVSVSGDLEKSTEELRDMLETTKRALDDQEVLSETLARTVNQYSALAENLYRQEWMRDKEQQEVNENQEYVQGNLLQLVAARVGEAAEDLFKRVEAERVQKEADQAAERATAKVGYEAVLEQLKERFGQGKGSAGGVLGGFELIESPKISSDYVDVESPPVSHEYVKVEHPEILDDWEDIEPFIERDVDEDYTWIGRESELGRAAAAQRGPSGGVQLLPERVQREFEQRYAPQVEPEQPVAELEASNGDEGDDYVMVGDIAHTQPERDQDTLIERFRSFLGF